MPTKSRTPKRKAAIPTTAWRIRELLTEKHYTIQQFADRFGSKLNTAREWLAGRVLPRAETLADIVKQFGVTTDWLLAIEGAPKYRSQSRDTVELEADVEAYIVREVAQAAAGMEWATMLERAEVSGERFLALGVAREVERITVAWASSVIQARHAAEAAERAQILAELMTPSSEPLVIGGGRATAKDEERHRIARMTAELDRDSTFWAWMARGADGALGPRRTTKTPDGFTLGGHTPAAFREAASAFQALRRQRKAAPPTHEAPRARRPRAAKVAKEAPNASPSKRVAGDGGRRVAKRKHRH